VLLVQVTLTLDGTVRTFTTSADETLLRLLRRHGFFQVKQGCGVGDCGSCAVLIDGRARNACLTLAGQVDGAVVTTTVGMGTPTTPSTLQRSMADEGAVQCGFCIPGFLAGAEAVMTAVERPRAEDFARGLDGHMCRCTGYVNQVKALERAVYERGGGPAGDRPVARKIDALPLACGTSRFVEDVAEAREALVAKILPSPHAHARIRAIDAGRARALPGVHCVLTHHDVPRIPYCTAGQGAPEPSPHDSFILDDKVRFVGDRVAVVAAESEAVALAALELIDVDYEVLEPVLDPARAMAPGAPVIHDEPEAHAVLPIMYDKSRNRVSQVDVEVGDVAAALAGADLTVGGTFASQVMHHATLEPHVCLASLEADDRIVIRSSTQVPFHARRLTAQALGIPVRRIRVVKPRVGGGFGGKQEVILEPLCALLAIRTRRPVLLRYTRAEEFAMGRTRHAQTVTVEVGATSSGELQAIRMQVLENTGAYGSHAHTVLCNAGCKTLPLYRCPNVAFTGNSVYTTLPVAGAFRGYGAPQAYFALEQVMDDLARRLDVDPVELRRRTTLRTGDTSPLWEVLGEGKQGVRQVVGSCGLVACLDRGAEAIGWERRPALPRTGRFRRGMGMAAQLEGSSVPEVDMASASLKLNEDGSFNLAMGATDLGQGSDTVLAQLAAAVLGVGLDAVIVLSSDTDVTPFDVGAYASSTTYLSGQAVERAARAVAAQCREVGARLLDRRADELVLRDGQVVAPDGRAVALSRVAAVSLYEEDQHQIAAFGSAHSHASPPPFGAQFAEVEVDVRTGVVRVVSYVAAVDCGRPLNPTLARGQMHGAVVQGLGYALTEEMRFDGKGRLVNGNFSEYPVFRMVDMPDVRVILVETHEPTGPSGAKSIGEIGLCGALPAIGNAIFDATGVRMHEAPFTPERVLRALKG